ncbi:relaxase [Chryseobacterium formosense]|uniref:Relaxase n=1 Tax=Chryseobacterium formosense TaxID=236814 RepID=A0A085Z8E3_9FLAO|nr:conjugal transfer protein MobB [Chryseobacterium formosense]KFF00707.1 relaxase [Chryseobacterium formosense]SFT36911.1 Relaxase/Mobilisation nuclease domain-containing protein [Chryseobacterium formosense]
MIAKIGRSSNLFGTLSYNNSKMEQDKGEILMTNKMIETADGKYSVAQLARSFEPYLLANRNTEKHTLHISLNPDPKDKVSDEKYRELAQLYMNEMGYGDQPFIVFKHTDIDRSHIHIVSVCVDEEGKKISDQFEKIRSMKVCRELEKKFGLISAVEKQPKQNQKIFRPVNFKSGDIKSQIASVIRHIPSYYQFQSLGEYNALLSLFNITVEKVEGELQGQSKKGLLYFPLDDQGKKAGNPVKASLFGKISGIDALEKHFTACKNKGNVQLVKQNLKRSIIKAHHSSKDEQAFKNKLKKEGIDIVVRKNDNSRIYGITFIDHKSRTVWNGSRLGKEFSANNFNDYWNNNIRPEIEIPDQMQTKKSQPTNANQPPEEYDRHFDFLNDSEQYSDIFIETLGILIPRSPNNNYEEEHFTDKIRKRKKRRRGQ